MIPFEVFSRSLIIVDPVVVNPETASKKESVTPSFPVEAINGRAVSYTHLTLPTKA